MNFSTKAASRIIGVLFIVAADTAIIGGFILYKPILDVPDYLIQGSALIILAYLLELFGVIDQFSTKQTLE